jgi:peptidoglycan/xylan/chitin deacetylase (PgdA/CDA1 family)
MLVSTRTLERQLDWIGRRYRFVPLDELARTAANGVPTHGKPIAAVTFDDGYADVYDNAFPLLVRKGIPGAVFAVADRVGGRRLHVHDELHALLRLAHEELGVERLAALLERHGAPAERLRRADGASPRLRMVELTEELLRSSSRVDVEVWMAALGAIVEIPRPVRESFRLMDWSMLRRLRAGGFLVGSHTRSHSVLPNEHDDRIASELCGSRAMLERGLGAEVRHLAYPGGQFCARTVEAAAAAGYAFAYTTCSHRLPGRETLTIPRRTFWERTCEGALGSFSPSIAACQVGGVFDATRPCRQPHRRAERRVAAARPAEASP